MVCKFFRQSFVQKVCKDDEKLEIHGRNVSSNILFLSTLLVLVACVL